MPLASSDTRPPSPPHSFRWGWLAIPTVLAGLSAIPAPSQANLLLTWGRGSFPVAGFAGFSSPFGLRAHPVTGGVRPHNGLDIAAPLGSAVRSWWSGTVLEVLQDSSCGNGLVIRSGAYEHLYCHLGGVVSGGTYRSGAVLLRQGQRVRTGQTIGHVGLSGSTTGPHLHWGLRYGRQWLDPAAVLRAMAADRRQQQPSRRRALNVGQLR